MDLENVYRVFNASVAATEKYKIFTLFEDYLIVIGCVHFVLIRNINFRK